tara:strand:+ start:1419 stop:1886 length:468 start_codon:yes stop_codon:yes gene_type:complete
VICIWVWEFTSFDKLLETIFPWENRYDLPNIIYGFRISNVFTASILSLAIAVGLFLKNKIGWLLITGWFYFILINLFKSLAEDGLPDISMFFQLFFLLLIPVGFIFLMNRLKGIKQYHRIENKKQMSLNLWAIGIGVLLISLRLLKKFLVQSWLT